MPALGTSPDIEGRSPHSRVPTICVVNYALVTGVFAIAVAAASPSAAQRLPFVRSLDVKEAAALDVSTMRGRIGVRVGPAGRILVRGTVTVRVGFDVPTNALDVARKIAGDPPIEHDGNTIRLRPPDDPAERRAVTVSYEVEVPPDTEVQTVSDSGATTVSGVTGSVVIRTQSGAVELTGVRSTAAVTSGSGSVAIDGVGGALTVTTTSSAITVRSLQGSARIRTMSGAVDVEFSGAGGMEVETGSSAIRLRNLRGGLTATTQSGGVSVEGMPSEAWNVSTGSGSVTISTGASAFTLDATSGSGQLRVDGATVQGVVSKRRIAGTIAGGGPHVTVTSRSGSIRVAVTERR